MRTTLTLDKDVASALEKLQRKRDATFKDIVNDALRQGLRAMNASEKPRKAFKTRAVDLGPPLFKTPQELKKLIAEMDDEHDRKKLGLS